MNLLWEQRIESTQDNSPEVENIDERYFMIQKATYLLDNHELLNTNDRNWLQKSREEISELSLQQLKLWIHNYEILRKLGHTEQIMRNE